MLDMILAHAVFGVLYLPFAAAILIADRADRKQYALENRS